MIVKVNNETIHDMADWRRALKTRSGKVTLAIVRDKKEQTVEMTVPANTSELKGQDWDGIQPEPAGDGGGNANSVTECTGDALDATMAQFDQSDSTNSTGRRRLRRRTRSPIEEAGEADRKQADAAMKAATPEMKKRAEELAKQAAEMRKANRAGA